MNNVSGDSGRGPKISRKLVCVSNEGFVPVNEIPPDSGRKELSIKIGFPTTKHEYLFWLIKLEKMATDGDIHPAILEVTGTDKEPSYAINRIASGILKHNERLNLGDMFPEIKTCPPKFSQNTARE